MNHDATQVGRRAQQKRAKRVMDMTNGFMREGAPAGKARLKTAERYDHETGEWLKTCPVCSQPFRAKRFDAATCSTACRLKRSRSNRRQGLTD